MNNQTGYKEFVPTWNVVDGEPFSKRVRNVFKQVAETLTHTLGPEGSNTIIERHGDIHITKDGWNILKKIQFTDSIDNTILQLLVNIASQVVIKVGDGSTSSIVASHELLTSIERSDVLESVRPKLVVDTINKIATRISEGIQQRAQYIDYTTPEGLHDIFRLALVSTNGDEEIANIIKDIYEQTGNPAIDYQKSRTNRTFYEIVDGYEAPISLMDGIYKNNAENGTCDIDAPVLMMFDHTINKHEHWDELIQHVVHNIIESGANRRLVVIAPHFDRTLVEFMRYTAQQDVRRGTPSMVVFARVSMVNNLFQAYYKDFSVMTGAEIITENDMDRFLGRDRMADIMRRPTDESEEEKPTPVKEGKISLDDYIGQVNKISLGDQYTVIRGFANRKESMYQVVLTDAISRHQKILTNNMEMNIVNPEVYELKKRVSKLKGMMGVIHVGGNSYLEKTANYDLVDDAVRAAECASTDGYNIGGNLIIPIVITDLKTVVTDPLEAEILDLFDNAFRSVYSRVLGNKYKEESYRQLAERVDESVKRQAVFNLITEEFDNEVINPCMTDIEILRAVSSIISMIKGSNQFLSISAETEFKSE